MVNAGVCLRLDETLSNILAMKLALPEKKLLFAVSFVQVMTYSLAS